jgi:hypothetical protein
MANLLDSSNKPPIEKDRGILDYRWTNNGWLPVMDPKYLTRERLWDSNWLMKSKSK